MGFDKISFLSCFFPIITHSRRYGKCIFGEKDEREGDPEIL